MFPNRLKIANSILRCKNCFLQDSLKTFGSKLVETHIGSNGRDVVRFEAGHIARLADGAAVVSQGDTSVLATVVGKQSSGNDMADFMPLTVDFQQSASAIGRIPTNYLRRELQQSDADILASRMIDRSIRPLFPKEYCGETQVICKPLAVDDDGDPVILGLNAVSTALALSDIPWNGPLGAVRIALIENQVVINPSRKEIKNSELDLVIAGCDQGKRVLMIDMDGVEIEPEVFEQCVESGLQAISHLIQAINEICDSCGRSKRRNIYGEIDIDLLALTEEMQILCGTQLQNIFTDFEHDKISRDKAVSALSDQVIESLKDRSTSHKLRRVFTNLLKKSLREMLFKDGRRCDGRKLDGFRPIDIKVDVHKKLHGSALFQRGQTQVLSTVTFDSPSAAFQPDALSLLLGAQQKKMFMLHYQFPSFATTAISPSRRTTRRELGHGALAEKALKRLIPENFPYCIRLACDVLESNGSSSMASVCSGCLALLDAGVQMKAPAAGVAMGLFMNDEQEYCVLTDINGLEDFAGDMDFKIAGTMRGYTAMQMDLKIPGIKLDVVAETLGRARKGLEHVLELMRKAQPGWREHFKNTVPVHETIPVAIYKRHILFRSGGYNSKLVESETGAKISIEDDANISIFAPNKQKLEEAKGLLNKIFENESDVEMIFGAMYKAEIIDVLEHGVMVTLQKGMKPILLKNSNLDTRNVAHAKVLGFKVGQKIIVQYLGRDPVTGQNRSDITSTRFKNLERPPRMFSKCPVPEIDEYFEYIAKIGRPLFKWEVIRPAFLWKLEYYFKQTISEMVCVETELAVSEEDRKLLISDDELREQRQFIIQKGTEFDGTPFTFQRLCELLTSPTRHYKRASKYLRALEKNINVVTTITENGERITGIETDAEDLDAVPCNRIEVPFFVQVDECDTPIETKMFATGSRLSRVHD
ncbi:unnamed protein product [Thelazia callipaeda]|uniref:polyribonucleotide nucleotidyltransferase n=1 Tax=Thelazia callipaeda TaxID=103827 RepID=A0A158RCJ8_THECL|nr:unnamed protein product [Thelazia callipaeda]